MKDRRALCELSIGIIITGIIFQIGLIVAGLLTEAIGNHKLYYFTGLWIGVLLALCSAFHMNHSLEIALSQDAETATKIVRKDSLVRYFAFVLLFGGMMLINIVSPLTAFLGLMSLKFGAYLNPVAKKILNIYIGVEEQKPLLTPEEYDELYGKKVEE